MPRMRMFTCAVALAVLTGCASKGAVSGSTPPPEVRQELTVGQGADQFTLTGPNANLGNGMNVAEPLMMLTPEYEVRPLLAERWELREPNTWRFFLRRGVTFHDGEPLTAAAVKTGLFDRVAQQRGGGTIKAGPSSAVVVDDYTIDFTPTAPNLRLPEQLVHPSTSVIAPGSDPGTKPVGTGPFRFVEYAQKERLVVERNPTYWGQRPALDRITFRFYPDDQSRRLALDAHDIQLAVNIPRADVKGLKDRGVTVVPSAVGAYEAMYLNIHGTPPHDILRDAEVRKAVAAAVNRRDVIQVGFDGQATEDVTFVPPASLSPHSSLVKGVAHDQAAARASLDKAGWRSGSGGIREKDGRRLQLTLVSGFPDPAAHQGIPELVQAQLKEIGIDVKVEKTADEAVYEQSVTDGKGDLFLEQGNQNDANPAFLPLLLFSNAGSGASSDYQRLFAPGGRFDELMASTLTESSADKVRQATAGALHDLIDEQAVVVPLAGIYRLYGVSKEVRGFTPHPSTLNLRWDGVSISPGR